LAGGIRADILDDRMSRSILFQAPNLISATNFAKSIKQHTALFEKLVRTASRFAKFLDSHCQIVGNLIYLRIEISTGDASGHNMVTLAAEKIMNWILENFPKFRYISISGNYCIDKKVSAVNGILGRGKYVVTEVVIPRKLCKSVLKTTPEKIVELTIKKNYIGTTLAGGIRTANAHFANILLAIYLATGQDAANIIEGSQGIVHTEMNNDDLYFSATLPNIIVGSIGNGKDLDFAKRNLSQLGCMDLREPGLNSRRLAVITAATVLCGELSLLAALTNPGELMTAHTRLERP
jgi:hydroxymethylglutaryl-CoA reductase (NADPH)